jgi:hypothetical protein
MKHRTHYSDAEKDQVPPGARYMARADQERQRTRDRMNAVDPGESTRRMNAEQRKAPGNEGAE